MSGILLTLLGILLLLSVGTVLSAYMLAGRTEKMIERLESRSETEPVEDSPKGAAESVQRKRALRSA